MTDLEHLQAYRRSLQPADLEPLVRRNLDWVYSSARRQLRNDEHLAADVVQAVFMALASKPPELRSDGAIAGWLYQVTRYAAAGALRAAARRRRHEEQAAMLRSELDTVHSDPTWADVAPHLEACVAKLPEKDRQSVVLRFYQRCSFAEVGAAMGISEEAARKRVGRAVERLRDMFVRQGIRAEQTSALAVALLAHSTTSAPISISSAGILAGTGSGAQALSLGSGALKMLAMARLKAIAALVVIAVVPAMGVALLAQLRSTPPIPSAATTSPATRQADANSDLVIHAVDETGKPVERAEVYVTQAIQVGAEEIAERRSSIGPVLTDAQGHARISGLEPAQIKDSITRSIYIRRPGELVGAERVYIDSGKARSADPVTIKLFPSAPVRGLVLVPEGHRAEDVAVTLLVAEIPQQADTLLSQLSAQIHPQELRDAWPQLFSAPVAPNGQFVLENIPAGGRVSLRAKGSGLGEVQVARERFDTRTIELRMAKEAVLAGVLSFKGHPQPLRKAAVFAIPQDTALLSSGAFSAMTNERGEFRIEGLPTGVYRLRAQRQANNDWTMQTLSGIRVTEGQVLGDLKLEYEPGVVVKGRVISASGNDGVSGAQVAALSPAETNGEQVDYATTDQAGGFTMRLPAGKTRIYLAFPGAGYVSPQDSGARDMTVAADGSVHGDLRFAVSKAAVPARAAGTVKLNGQVVDPDGKPLPRVVVGHEQPMPFDEGQNLTIFSPNAAQTDDAGRFELTIEAGVRHVLRISSADYRGQAEPIVPRPGEPVTVRIIATPHPVLGQISGVVVDPNGAPLAGVQINPGSANNEKVITDPQGAFIYPIRQLEQPATLVMVAPGYETRNWNGIPLDAKDLKFVLHPASGRPAAERKPVVASATLVGKPAPSLEVDTWVHLADKDRPPVIGGDQRMTLLLFCNDDDKIQQRIAELQAAAERLDAQAVILFSTYLHPAGVRELLGQLKLQCSVAVDRYVPGNEYAVNGATRIAYGAERMNRIYQIGAEGLIITDRFSTAAGK